MSKMDFSHTAAFIWSVADLLRGDFKQSQYGRIILPFALLRRLECVLENSKDAVVTQAHTVNAMDLPEEAREKLILRATGGLTFFNTSPMNLSNLGQKDIRDNLENYIQNFSTDAREIFEHFKFSEFIIQLDEANLLFKVVQKVASTDLSPAAVSNHDMGLVFEELIRRFAEGSNETAGEHFTPRDIVRLTTALIFMKDDEALTRDGIIRTIYDPTAGTGGFLSAGMEYLHELNPNGVMRAFGQELNPESYAICKADMLIKGQDVSLIKLGNTLSNDQLPAEKFDYMLSNPPFGVDWKKIETEISDEHTVKGFDGRFGAGLPRVSDGSLLFLLHLISKMRDSRKDGGGRIGIILNGSPLFTGGAGSGESEIRRHILEADLLEGIVALPTDMFYNTGISTYVWILSNNKDPARKGKVQLIDGSSLCGKMRKSLGSKRNLMGEEDIKLITRTFGDFAVINPTRLHELGLEKAPEQKSGRGRQSASSKKDAPKTFASKIFNSTDFGYRRLTIERPLRLSAHMTDEAIAGLRFAPKPFNAPMERLYQDFAAPWTAQTYGDFSDVETEARAIIKADFPELKEKQIKDLLDAKLWLAQRALMEKARQIQTAFGTTNGGKHSVSNDFNLFENALKTALSTAGVKLDNKEKKQFIEAVTTKNPAAEPVVKKVLKESEQPLYGAFRYKGKVVEFEQDGDLRDNENVPLNPAIATSVLIESYFEREVKPHVSDAWINADKRDARDNEIGVVGYEIPFNRHFYVYQPPSDLKEIDADLDAISAEIMALLQEAHSSQSGSTARQLKEVLMLENTSDDVELSSEDIIDATMAARRGSNNLNYYAFTATPKAKTLELFGRLPNPNEPASKTNRPQAFHVYSMRQAIEEGFILDVLKNYVTYHVAYKLAQKQADADKEVDDKKANRRLTQWVRLHDYNIAQKVKVIIEHYKNHVMNLLGGQAKAMVVTRSRKEAVRYKLAFDKYIHQNHYQKISAMVAFSGEVEFSENDPNSEAQLGQKYTETNMNPGLKGRDMRKAFDSDDYQVMLVANKFQTGFDQPKLCAMYVDKPLGGVECVQTLSRLNRIYPVKAASGTFILDFVNDPDDILQAFRPYYQTAELTDVSDPALVFELFEKLRTSGIFQWREVEQFCTAFFSKNKSGAALSNISRPAVERWEKRYASATEAYLQSKRMFEITKTTREPILIANAENTFKECKREKDRLEIFKKDLGSFVRFYEFISQIVDYDNQDLEKLSLFARHLRPLLRESNVQEDDVDLQNVVMSHYRLSKMREQQLRLTAASAEKGLQPGNDVGSAKPKDKKEDFMSQILERLNALFVGDHLTDKDMINCAFTVKDKISENTAVMTQLANNTREQAMLGDFPKAVDEAIMDCNAAQQNMMMQYLSNPALAKGFAQVVFDMLKAGGAVNALRG